MIFADWAARRGFAGASGRAAVEKFESRSTTTLAQSGVQSDHNNLDLMIRLIARPSPPLRLHDRQRAFLARSWNHAQFDARLRS